MNTQELLAPFPPKLVYSLSYIKWFLLAFFVNVNARSKYTSMNIRILGLVLKILSLFYY